MREKTLFLSTWDSTHFVISSLFQQELPTDNIDEIKDEDDKEGARSNQQPRYPWEGTDRDYLYEELVDTIFRSFGEKRRTSLKLPVPEVLRLGTKKTVLVNFVDFCNAMHRQPDHLSSFMEMELATNLSVDDKLRLVVGGKFAPKHFEFALKQYANEYVICNSCRSSDTTLSKENRLMFLRCEQCGSGKSVSSITKGFRARVGRKSA